MALVAPLSVLAMMIFGLYEARQRRKGRRPGKLLSGTYTDEVTALFYSSKRQELDQRDLTSILRDEQSDGAPPFGIDLDRGTFRASSLAPDRDDRSTRSA